MTWVIWAIIVGLANVALRQLSYMWFAVDHPVRQTVDGERRGPERYHLGFLPEPVKDGHRALWPSWKREMFGLFPSKPKRLSNITVYCLGSIDQDGVKTAPLGVTSRLTNAQERTLATRHKPSGKAYLNDTMSGVTAIFYWTGSGVDAVSFLSEEDAMTACPKLVRFTPEALRELDPVLLHFPR